MKTIIQIKYKGWCPFFEDAEMRMNRAKAEAVAFKIKEAVNGEQGFVLLKPAVVS